MKRYSQALGTVLGLAALPLLLSCSDPAGLEDIQNEGDDGLELIHQKPMTLVIHPSAADIEVGETIRLRAVLHAADGRVLDTDFDVTWSTSRPERVAITPDGYAIGREPGFSRIMAESAVASDWTYVTVWDGAPPDSPPGGKGDEELEDENEDEEGYRVR
jgi:hypothetical protein